MPVSVVTGTKSLEPGQRITSAPLAEIALAVQGADPTASRLYRTSVMVTVQKLFFT